MSQSKPSYEELARQLAEAQAIIANLRNAKNKAASGDLDAARPNALLYSREIAKTESQSEKNFRNSLDAYPLGVRIVTAEGDLIYANQAILDLWGFKTIAELSAAPRQQLYTPESYAAHQERKRKRKLKECVPQEYNISILRADGEVRNFRVFRREVIWDGEQQFLSLYQDITEQLRAEEALKESEEKFHSIVEHGNDGIVFLQDGKVLYFNSKMLEMSGYSAARGCRKINP